LFNASCFIIVKINIILFTLFLAKNSELDIWSLQILGFQHPRESLLTKRQKGMLKLEFRWKLKICKLQISKSLVFTFVFGIRFFWCPLFSLHLRQSKQKIAVSDMIFSLPITRFLSIWISSIFSKKKTFINEVNYS